MNTRSCHLWAATMVGPELMWSPQRRLPTHDTVLLLESKCKTRTGRSTPKLIGDIGSSRLLNLRYSVTKQFF